MLAILFVVVITLISLGVIWCVRNTQGIDNVLTGTVDSFRLTFGQQGQQIVTIDGKEYSIWLNFKEFGKVERGNVVTHRPYKDQMHSHSGKRLLCTTILSVEHKKKKNATSSQSSSRNASR